MTNNMKQVKFDMLINELSDKFYFEADHYSRYAFNKIYCEITPLCIFFDTNIVNGYRKSIFFRTRLVLDYQYFPIVELYPNRIFSDDIDKKLYLTRNYIKKMNGLTSYSGRLQDDNVTFIFWALLAACVDKDYDEKIPLIAEFAQAINISDDSFFDIIHVIKIILGEEDKNVKFKTENDKERKIPQYFERALKK